MASREKIQEEGIRASRGVHTKPSGARAALLARGGSRAAAERPSKSSRQIYPSVPRRHLKTLKNMSAATWDDLGPEARVLRDVMRSRAFGAVSGKEGALAAPPAPRDDDDAAPLDAVPLNGPVAGRKFQVPPPSLPFAIAEPPASPTAARGS